MATERQRTRKYNRRRHHQDQAAQQRREERERVRALGARGQAALAGKRPEDRIDLLAEYERERASRSDQGSQLPLA